MKTAGGGSIINISSVEGMRGSPAPYGYVASNSDESGHMTGADLVVDGGLSAGIPHKIN